MRQCRVCGEHKPESKQYFCEARCRTGKVYLSRRCRSCDAAATRRHWRESPGAKERDKASRDRRREQIREYDRMRAKRDREKKRVIIARWIANNPERHRAMRRAIAARYRIRLKARLLGEA